MSLYDLHKASHLGSRKPIRHLHLPNPKLVPVTRKKTRITVRQTKTYKEVLKYIRNPF